MQRHFFTLILLIVSHFCIANEVVEEVLAVVEDTPILASDLALAAAAEIIPQEANERPEKYDERVLDALVRLELQYQDLEASASLLRLEIDAEPLLRRMTDRCTDGTTLRPDLRKRGLRESDIENLAHRMAAVAAYVDQRLTPRISVSFQELETAYREIIVEPMEVQGQEPPPLVSVRDRLAEVVTQRKLNAEIERWLQQARERLEVTRFRR